MKKIEIIWRELLFQALERGERRFTQQGIAEEFGVSTSTVFQALKVPRKMGAVRVTGRWFNLEDSEKLLYYWASERDSRGDVVWQGRTELPVETIEGLMPGEVVMGGFRAARHWLDEAVPADYDKVYVYSHDVEAVKQRFEWVKGEANVIVLQADPWLTRYGEVTTLAQTFVDIWNMAEWYAKEFIRALRRKWDEVLS